MKNTILFLTILILPAFAAIVGAQTPEMMPTPGYGMDRTDAPRPDNYRFRGRIRIEKDRNEFGYQLKIYTSGDFDPESVQVSIQGNSILIENDRSFQREERYERGGYSYSRNSSSFRRRLSIPRNADVNNMTRHVENGVLIINLPYLNGYGR